MVYKIIHIDLNGVPNIMTTELSNINLFEEDFQKYSLNKSNYYVMYGTHGKHRIRLKFTDDIFYSNLYVIKTRCNNNLTNIKLEDITVTSHPKNPSNPIMEIADNAQQIIGRKIQRILLKMMLKVMIRKNNTPSPKIFKSLLIKLTRSSAIMLTPPKKRSAPSRYLSIIPRILRIF